MPGVSITELIGIKVCYSIHVLSSVFVDTVFMNVTLTVTMLCFVVLRMHHANVCLVGITVQIAVCRNNLPLAISSPSKCKGDSLSYCSLYRNNVTLHIALYCHVVITCRLLFLSIHLYTTLYPAVPT